MFDDDDTSVSKTRFLAEHINQQMRKIFCNTVSIHVQGLRRYTKNNVNRLLFVLLMKQFVWIHIPSETDFNKIE